MSVKPLHIKSLKVFCDVVGRRSFSRAADENGISQSGASQIVQQLEEHLDTKLIDRSKRPFVLTPAGELYYEGCRKLVQKYFTLEEEVRAMHQATVGRVGVASIYSIGLSHLDRYVHEFQQQHSEATVRLEYQHPDKVHELVENDQVDLGLISYPKSTRAVKAIPWREDPMVVVFATDHPLAGRASVSIRELSGMEFVAFNSYLRIRRELDKSLESHDVEVNVVLEFDNIETLKSAIEVNAGLSLLPRPTVEREIRAGLLAAAELEDVRLTRPLGIIHRRGKELGKTARCFLDFLLLKAPISPTNLTNGPRAKVDKAAQHAVSDANSAHADV